MLLDMADIYEECWSVKLLFASVIILVFIALIYYFMHAWKVHADPFNSRGTCILSCDNVFIITSDGDNVQHLKEMNKNNYFDYHTSNAAVPNNGLLQSSTHKMVYPDHLASDARIKQLEKESANNMYKGTQLLDEDLPDTKYDPDDLHGAKSWNIGDASGPWDPVDFDESFTNKSHSRGYGRHGFSPIMSQSSCMQKCGKIYQDRFFDPIVNQRYSMCGKKCWSGKK